MTPDELKSRIEAHTKFTVTSAIESRMFPGQWRVGVVDRNVYGYDSKVMLMALVKAGFAYHGQGGIDEQYLLLDENEVGNE